MPARDLFDTHSKTRIVRRRSTYSIRIWDRDSGCYQHRRQFQLDRHGAPIVVPFNGDVYVRYMGKWEPALGEFTSAIRPMSKDTSIQGNFK